MLRGFSDLRACIDPHHSLHEVQYQVLPLPSYSFEIFVESDPSKVALWPVVSIKKNTDYSSLPKRAANSSSYTTTDTHRADPLLRLSLQEYSPDPSLQLPVVDSFHMGRCLLQCFSLPLHSRPGICQRVLPPVLPFGNHPLVVQLPQDLDQLLTVDLIRRVAQVVPAK
jgi:hypothetical protein